MELYDICVTPLFSVSRCGVLGVGCGVWVRG